MTSIPDMLGWDLDESVDLLKTRGCPYSIIETSPPVRAIKPNRPSEENNRPVVIRICCRDGKEIELTVSRFKQRLE